MPNECHNYLRLEAGLETLAIISQKPFDIDSYCAPPETMSDNDLYTWYRENYTCSWISTFDRSQIPPPKISHDGKFIELFFISSWAPPIGFYKKLSGLFPDLTINYEYNEWGAMFCGYGLMSLGETPDPNHYTYDSEEELQAIVRGHTWTLVPYNPHFYSDSDTDME